MQDLEMKKKVLQEMMDLMDQKDGESLKGHPKMMALKVEAKPEGSPEEESAESSEVEDSEDELSPEMVQKILEMYKQMQ